MSGGTKPGNVIGWGAKGYFYGSGTALTSQVGTISDYFIIVNGELPNYNDLYNEL